MGAGKRLSHPWEPLSGQACPEGLFSATCTWSELGTCWLCCPSSLLPAGRPPAGSGHLGSPGRGTTVLVEFTCFLDCIQNRRVAGAGPFRGLMCKGVPASVGKAWQSSFGAPLRHPLQVVDCQVQPMPLSNSVLEFSAKIRPWPHICLLHQLCWSSTPAELFQKKSS